MVTHRTKLNVRAAVLIRFIGIARVAPLKAAPWKRDISVAINALVSPAIRSKISRGLRARKIFCAPSRAGKSWVLRSLSKPKKNFSPAIIAVHSFFAGPENAASAAHWRDEKIFAVKRSRSVAQKYFSLPASVSDKSKALFRRLQNSLAAQTNVSADLALRQDLLVKTLSMAAQMDIVWATGRKHFCTDFRHIFVSCFIASFWV